MKNEKAVSSVFAFTVFRFVRILFGNSYTPLVHSLSLFRYLIHNECGFAHRFRFNSFFLTPAIQFNSIQFIACVICVFFLLAYCPKQFDFEFVFFSSYGWCYHPIRVVHLYWAIEHMVEQFYSNCEYVLMKLKLYRTILIMKMRHSQWKLTLLYAYLLAR